MGTLRFYSIILKKLNKTSTLPFNIISYIQGDMITFNNLSDRTKSRLCKNILFYFMVLLKNDSKNSLSCVPDKK